MSEQTDAYRKVIEDIINNYDGADGQFKKIDNAADSPCDINQIVNNMPNMNVVKNNGGNIVGYDYKYTAPGTVDSKDMEVDSNSGGSTYGITGGGGTATRGSGAGRYVGNFNSSTGFEAAKDNNGNPLISGFVDAGWAVVSTLSKFGKNVAGAAADSIDSIAQLSKDTFNNIFVKSLENGADAIRALFGVDSQGNTTMYLDEDTLGALAITERDAGVFSGGTEGSGQISSLPVPVPSSNPYWQRIIFPVYTYTSVGETLHGTSNQWRMYILGTQANGQYFGIGRRYDWNGGLNPIPFTISFMLNQPGNMIYYIASYPVEYGNVAMTSFNDGHFDENGNFISVVNSSFTYNLYTIDERSYYCIYDDILSLRNIGTTVCQFTQNPGVPGISVAEVHNLIGYLQQFNNETTPTVPGISDQTGATDVSSSIVGSDPRVVVNDLLNNYSQVMGDPIQIVTLDDSCNETVNRYFSVPISYSPTTINAGVPITGGLQLNPSFNPDVQLDLPDIDLSKYTEQIINQLRGSGAGRDTVTVDPTTGEPEIIQGEVPNTGEGVTPPEVIPEADVKAIWHVYNPSSSQLSALGSWMWDQTIIDQIIRLFNNPMEAIIGLHAVFKAPEVGSSSAIIVGNLTSSVSALTVSRQYTSLDCGTVMLPEYFGNVFDYAPYTQVKLYLPFIGIVDLDVADVMRGFISVKYMIDVYTGACTATVSVERDGVGGVLYQYSGNCATQYPVSGASYSRVWQALSSMVAVGVGQAARGNFAGAAAGMVSQFTQAKVDVAHSGSFSGNPGAMGIKKPYLIITRPQTNMAVQFEHYDGRGSNYTSRVGDCTGYIKCKEVHLNVPGAYKDELDEIERLLKEGILI